MYICVNTDALIILPCAIICIDVLFPVQESWKIKFGTFRYIVQRISLSFTYINTISMGLTADANTINLWATRRDEQHPPLQEVCHYIQC